MLAAMLVYNECLWYVGNASRHLAREFHGVIIPTQMRGTELVPDESTIAASTPVSILGRIDTHLPVL